MSKFFSALKGILKKDEPKAAPEGKRESRVFQRFNIGHSDLFHVELPNGDLTPIINLSFGGMGIASAPADTQAFPITIKFLKRKMNARLAVAHRGSTFVGTRFEARESALINFLQPLLEGISQGLSMRTIDLSALKDAAKDEYEWVLRGEGPTDLLVASSVDPCSNAVLTFRSGKEYLELTLKDDTMTTAKTLDLEGRSARMTRDPRTDPRVLELALLILTGTMEQASLQSVMKPVLEAVRRKYDLITQS